MKPLHGLLVLVPLLAIGLPLRDELGFYHRNRLDGHVTVVPHGGTGSLDHASWRLAGLRVVGPDHTVTGDAVRVRAVLDVKALDAAGATSLEIDYTVRDRSTGEQWHAKETDPGDMAKAGDTTQRTVEAVVPRTAAGQVDVMVKYERFDLIRRPGGGSELRLQR